MRRLLEMPCINNNNLDEIVIKRFIYFSCVIVSFFFFKKTRFRSKSFKNNFSAKTQHMFKNTFKKISVIFCFEFEIKY